MAASANSIKKDMDLTRDPATGQLDMVIRIRVDATPGRNAFVNGRPCGYGFTGHPAVTAGSIYETVACHVTELIKATEK
jgi:hypothetical protein